MIEGKIANQHVRSNMSGKTKCGKCQKLIPKPNTSSIVNHGRCSIFLVYSYLETPHWIYESKSGLAVVYCSKYCRNKYNHRFNK